MGRKSRDKGASGERGLAHELSRVLGVAADIPDVHIECKRTERLRLYEALQQAIDDAGGKAPIVVHRQNHKPWVVIVRLDDLPRLAVQIYLTLAQKA